MNSSPPKSPNRSFWLKHLYRWHWISSAVCLIGMLLFIATGITLNHAKDIEAEPKVTEQKLLLPGALLQDIQAGPEEGRQHLPPSISDWLSARLSVSPQQSAEWSSDEVYLSLPRPGGDAWLTIDRQSGEVNHELTDRGWLAYFNDLHKGRNTGAAWTWFLDIFAIASLIFCITGLFMLHLHSGQRPSTWPLVVLGLLVPVLLILAFIP